MNNAQHCFHCFQPIPRGVNITAQVAGINQPMCCYGCQAVTETIVEQGLTHFYKYRDVDANQGPALIPEELAGLDEQLAAYDDTEIQKEFVLTQNNHSSASLAVEGMTCAACAWLIERQLGNHAGVEKVVVNATTDRVHVTWESENTTLSAILKSIHRVGYKALPFQQADIEEQYERQRRSYIRRLGVAGIASMQTMMVAVGLYYDDIDSTTRLYFWWVSLLFTAPVFVYSCQPFFKNAWRALRSKSLNMDVPVSLAIIFAFFASFYATITDTGQVYYECVTMFAFFLLSGRYLELLARQKAITNAANLMKLIPAIAEKQTTEGWQKVMVKHLQPNDIIQIRPGEAIPVDGLLLSDQGWCDEAQLTGESRPIAKRAGDIIYAGSINQETPIRIEVTHTHQNTLLAGIIHLQDEALGQKPRVVQLADRVSKYFVLATLIIATGTYIGWYFVAPEKAFWTVLAVLVATCPCALSLAAPTAMSGAVSRLNQSGILLKQANVLAALPPIKTICFDKTGTLTEGRFSILNHWSLYPAQQAENEAIAAALEFASEHPIAQPFRRLAQPAQLNEVTNIPGLGVVGSVGSEQYRIGSLEFIQQLLGEIESPLPQANVFLASKEGLIAAWRVDDELRRDAEETIQWCHAQGFRTIMLTGDNHERAQFIGNQLGLDNVHAQLKPTDKLELLRTLQQHGPVLMVGDGINDAPVLAQANASFTFASGSDLAQAGSDVVILNGELLAIRRLFDTATQVRKVIRQNFAWALGYNGIILPLAVAGFIGPLWAMLGMSTSSLIVISNSLRLLRRQRY